MEDKGVEMDMDLGVTALVLLLEQVLDQQEAMVQGLDMDKVMERVEKLPNMVKVGPLVECLESDKVELAVGYLEVEADKGESVVEHLEAESAVGYLVVELDKVELDKVELVVEQLEAELDKLELVVENLEADKEVGCLELDKVVLVQLVPRQTNTVHQVVFHQDQEAALVAQSTPLECI
ncbi:uncharacterized protein LOC144068277 [Stigmatopora argus]